MPLTYDEEKGVWKAVDLTKIEQEVLFNEGCGQIVAAFGDIVGHKILHMAQISSAQQGAEAGFMIPPGGFKGQA